MNPAAFEALPGPAWPKSEAGEVYQSRSGGGGNTRQGISAPGPNLWFLAPGRKLSSFLRASRSPERPGQVWGMGEGKVVPSKHPGQRRRIQIQ